MQPDGREARVDEREVVVERRDQAHQVHHLGAPVPVRQVVREHLGVGERPRELLDARGVRAVAAADEECVAVEPERVAAVDRPGRLDPRRDRHARPLEVGLEGARLAQPPLLAGPEEHGSLLAHEQRVVGVDRVRVARLAVGDDHLGAAPARAARAAPRARRPPRRDRARRASRTRASARRRRAAAGGRARAGAERSSSGRRSRSREPERQPAEKVVALGRTGGRPRSSTPRASVPAAPGPPACRGTGAPARPSPRSARSAPESAPRRAASRCSRGGRPRP